MVLQLSCNEKVIFLQLETFARLHREEDEGLVLAFDNGLQPNRAETMNLKRNISLCFVWSATIMLLLSAVVLHHHHMDEICVAQEMCVIDGSVNDCHTAHQEKEEDDCVVRQMHCFVLSVKHVSDVSYTLISYLPATVATAPLFACKKRRTVAMACDIFSADVAEGMTLRGPPAL